MATQRFDKLKVNRLIAATGIIRKHCIDALLKAIITRNETNVKLRGRNVRAEHAQSPCSGCRTLQWA
jgi:hypothetical protein